MQVSTPAAIRGSPDRMSSVVNVSSYSRTASASRPSACDAGRDPRGAAGQVGAVGGGTAVAHHLTRDGGRGAVEAPGDLRVGQVVGQPLGDLLAFLLGEPGSRHRDLLGSSAVDRIAFTPDHCTAPAR